MSSFFQTIGLKNFLSFGNSHEEFRATSLNVFIGPNATGKSNLLEAIGLLRAAPRDITEPIRDGGGIGEWIWKGTDSRSSAEIEITANYSDGMMPIRHKITFAMVGQRFEIIDEAIENERPDSLHYREPRFFYRYQQGRPVLNVRTVITDPPRPGEALVKRSLRREHIAVDQSVLSQIKDPEQYPEITYLGTKYSSVRMYREWNFGRYTAPRLPQKVDQKTDFLEENAGNLALILNHLLHNPSVKNTLLERLRTFNESIVDIYSLVEGGTIQLWIHEKGLRNAVPATRLSDGTLHFVCLLAVLCHPSPPSVICIEEPELGLHPDILPTVAELLQEAANRTQIFVTTHSDILVDALSDSPESVVVCDKDENGTILKRLAKSDLLEWLDKYSLGQLWRKGEIGGTRW